MTFFQFGPQFLEEISSRFCRTGAPTSSPRRIHLVFSALNFFDLFAELAHSHTLSFKQHSYEAVSEDRCMPVMTDRQHLCLHLSEHNMQPWMKDKAHTYSCQVALIHWQSHSKYGRCKYCTATNYKIVPSTPHPLNHYQIKNRLRCLCVFIPPLHKTTAAF